MARTQQHASSAHAYFTGGATLSAPAPGQRAQDVSLPLVVGAGDVFGVAGLGFARGLDERGIALASALANQLAIALDRLEQRRAHQTLLAMASHELGNAALAMKLSLRTLADGLPGPAPAALGDLAFLAQGMEVLVEDLDARSRLEADRFRLRLRPTDLGAVARRAMRGFHPAAVAAGVDLVCEVAPRLPRVGADAVRLSQVVSNLIGNALKHTPRGGRVSLELRRVRQQVRITLTDSGPGIPPHRHAKVFEPFWQASDRSRVGRGLGLSICEGIVHAHGGRIWVEPRRKRGARFHFTLPVG